MRELSAVWHDKAAGQSALQSLDDLGRVSLPLPVRPHGSNFGTRFAAAPPAVQVSELHFAHAGEAPLFEGLSLHVGAGEHVALWGASGSGKTALLSLLAGLLPFEQGRIEIGGVPMTPQGADALRRRIGWMGQRPHVFATSVDGNIALGRPAVDARRVAAALDLARLGSVEQARPPVALGEGGRGLSGGEAVRLALARLAVADEADLLLVDEPTAHLDRATAERVGDALVALARGRTLIVATHDPVLAARLGRIIRLDLAQLGQAA